MPVVIALAGAAAAAAIRWHLLDVPLERDEGEYAYAGRLLLEGVPPFRSVYGMKLPGTHVAYAAAIALLGPTPAAVRSGLLAVNLASTALVFLLGRSWLGAIGGMGAAVAFAFLSLQTAMLGPFGHATHFVVLPALAGLLALERALGSTARHGAWIAGAGLALGVAVVMKQPGVVFLGFALARLVAAERSGEGERPGRRMLPRDALLLVGAAALPTALVLLWAALSGDLAHVAGWLFGYGAGYAAPLPLAEGALWLRIALGAIVRQAPLLWALVGAGLVLALLPGERVPHRARLLVLLGFSFLGVCPGLTFREHYFLLAMPAAALLAGAAVAALARALARRGGASTAFAAAALLVLLAGAQSLWAPRTLLFFSTPEQVSRVIFGDNPFPESAGIAAWLAAHTAPDDRIAVFGSEPQIPFLAGRRSATGHVYMYPLLEVQPRARAMQEEMMREVAAVRPAYVVSIRVPTSWVRHEGADARILDEMQTYLRDGYAPCGFVVAQPDGSRRFLWEAEATEPTPNPDEVVAIVMRRRDLAAREPSGAPR